ncbi:hypothetical protein [Enterococcus sp. 5B3_DIV0040]|uniref:hypothetical protein n=1 Tax=Enterococcus sp. 5B3_DIV0040 TaxID=1834182 RepID=UPI000A33EA11|nr:hypothetical protein [Enterococcus sp. 5B3_DIV0040]OTO02223.1 hypothetical protein A5883_003050 [Enterococcus sp. 5B3_DIV0040]
MAFSTTHYYVKPIVPPIKTGICFRGSILRTFDARNALLLSEPFLSSSRFYYQNDPNFAKKLMVYHGQLKATRKALLSQTFGVSRHSHHLSNHFEAEAESIETIVNKLANWVFSPCALSFAYSLSEEERLSVKEGRFWLRKMFRQRKRAIQCLYPKKEYRTFHLFLHACNEFLYSLGEQSLQLTDSLDLFFDIGSNVDWFLLSITECDYHQSIAFKRLFSSTIRVMNDLVSIAGVFTIFYQPNALELYLAQEKTFLEKIKKYKELFRELVRSGNRIIELQTLMNKGKKELEIILKETKKRNEREEALQEIQSMHTIAVDRRKNMY